MSNIVEVPFPQIRYALENGPIKRHVESVLQELPLEENDPGVNCQLYVALVIRALGYSIPDYYRSSEWHEDPEDALQHIDYPREQIKNGDVLGFARLDETNMKRLHIGVARVNRMGGIEVLHASRLAGRVVVTPLENMYGSRRQMQKLHMVRRPKKETQTKAINSDALAALGWYASGC